MPQSIFGTKFQDSNWPLGHCGLVVESLIPARALADDKKVVKITQYISNELTADFFYLYRVIKEKKET